MKADFEKWVKDNYKKLSFFHPNTFKIIDPNSEKEINQFAEDHAKRFESKQMVFDFIEFVINYYEKEKSTGLTKKQFLNKDYQFMNECVNKFKTQEK